MASDTWQGERSQRVPVTALLIYSFFMGLGQPVIIMLQGELLSTNVRSIGTSIQIFVMYIGTFVVTQIYFLMVDSLGVYGTFWTYSVCSMFVAIFSFFALPETSGFSLEEITDKKNIEDGNHRKSNSQ